MSNPFRLLLRTGLLSSPLSLEFPQLSSQLEIVGLRQRTSDRPTPKSASRGHTRPAEGWGKERFRYTKIGEKDQQEP